MAFVVARPRGRFEIRESIHTPKGPRARTLANFEELTDKVLETARLRASRPFDSDGVRASARKAAASVANGRPGRGRAGGVATPPGQARRQFVEASRRMAQSVERVPPPDARRDPGEVLIGLLGFVAQVKPFGASRVPEPLQFPPLTRLREERIAGVHHR
jgi:hypothetical protein